jgi:Zn-dependent peptidase ImmA (M78 family)
MPAKSKKQQMAAGAALAAKRGKKSKSSLRGASRSMYQSMSRKELRKVAKTKRKNLPTRKRKRR